MKTRKMKMKKTTMKTTTIMPMKILLVFKSAKSKTSTGVDSPWILLTFHNDPIFNLSNKESKLATTSALGFKFKHFMEPSSANLVVDNTSIGMDLVPDAGAILLFIHQWTNAILVMQT